MQARDTRDTREQSDTALAERAAGAIARGDWSRAYEELRCGAEHRRLSVAELDLLARAAYGAGDLEASLTAREQVHARHVAAGDRVAAAGAAAEVAVYLMMDTGLMAPVRGWTTRAERLLEGAEECGVHAWLAMVNTYERLMSGDMERARHWAEQAIDIGIRRHEPAPAAIGRVAVARLLIFDGHVDEGLRLLDEAAVTILSSDLDPLTVGIIYCELVCAMQGLAQYDRAEEWTEAMERWRHGQAFGGINGRCRVHRAEIMRMRGSCRQAEEEALHACQELRPWMRREFGWPLTELGTIRLRKGDLGGAEAAFLAAHENGWDPQPGLALLHLARGEPVAASALVRHALESPLNVPSKERPPYGGLRRAPLLEAQAEIAVAEGRPATARQAASELTEIAATFRSRALAASASLAWGRVLLAEGDAFAAAAACEEAVWTWSDLGAPYEAARARMALARAHRALGNDDRAGLELQAARSAFERIGACSQVDEADWASDARRPVDGAHGPAAAMPVAPPATAATGTTGSTARTTPNVFRADGDTRSVAFDGHGVVLRDLKGMRYLARLLADPGREFHVLDLVANEQDASSTEAGVGPVLDAGAKDAYRRRLVEIDDDIEEATRLGDGERAALAEADRDYIVAELARAFGLGGRDRHLGSSSERARASVTRALRYAMDRVAAHHPALAQHLVTTVRTGTYCVYAPDPRVPITWTL